MTPFVREQKVLFDAGQLSKGAGTDTIKIRPEPGVAEWFGAAPFEHPQPADAATLKDLIPEYDETYVARVKASPRGETYDQLVARVSRGIAAIIAQCNAEGKKAVAICSHAASVIVLGRVLTGQFPECMDTDDFQAYTCGVSVYDAGKGMLEKLGLISWDTDLCLQVPEHWEHGSARRTAIVAF